MIVSKTANITIFFRVFPSEPLAKIAYITFNTLNIECTMMVLMQWLNKCYISNPYISFCKIHDFF